MTPTEDVPTSQGLRKSSHSYQGNFMLIGLIKCTDISDTAPAKPSIRGCAQEGKSQLLFQLMLARHRAQGHLPWCDCNGDCNEAAMEKPGPNSEKPLETSS